MIFLNIVRGTFARYIQKYLKLHIYALLIFSAFGAYHEVHARNPEPQFITDDEIESTLEDWLKELFDIAKISIPPKVYLLKSDELNAGATFGGIIIVYTGLIMKCKNAAQLIGVLAHETGHIAGTHLAKASSVMAESSMPAVASVLLGGAASILSGNPAPLMAGLAGGAHLFERALLKHSREQEDAADASALIYLNAKKWPVSGLVEFLDLLGNHYTTGHEDPYIQTHPLSHERKEKVKLYQTQQEEKARSENNGEVYRIPEAYEQRFQRIKAKLFGFLRTPEVVQREYPKKNASIAARYAHLISQFNRQGKSRARTQKALEKLDGLLTELPGDPYFLELKGQFCFETGRIADALPYLRQSSEKRPQSNSVRLMLAHALIELPNTSSDHLREALRHLTKVTEKQHDNTFAWRLMGLAYGKMNEPGNAAACLAEEAMLLDNIELAQMQARRGKEATNPVLAQKSRDILQQMGGSNGESKKKKRQ